jgi:hypothetical protein
MNNGWRPQATIAIICVVLLLLLVAVWNALKGLPAGAGGDGFFLVAFCLMDAVGLACANSGAHGGSRASRVASVVCLILLSLPIAACGVCFAYLVIRKPRFG